MDYVISFYYLQGIVSDVRLVPWVHIDKQLCLCGSLKWSLKTILLNQEDIVALHEGEEYVGRPRCKLRFSYVFYPNSIFVIKVKN